MRAAAPLTNARNSTSGSGSMLFLFSLLLPAVSDQNADHAVVSFVTGGIEDHVLVIGCFSHLDDHGPRLGPGFGIIEGDFTPQIVGVYAREALDHLVGFGVRPAEALRKIRGPHDE